MENEMENRVADLENKLAQIAGDVREIIHDLQVAAVLLGNILGEPFRSQARELVTKRQITEV